MDVDRQQQWEDCSSTYRWIIGPLATGGDRPRWGLRRIRGRENEWHLPITRKRPQRLLVALECRARRGLYDPANSALSAKLGFQKHETNRDWDEPRASGFQIFQQQFTAREKIGKEMFVKIVAEELANSAAKHVAEETHRVRRSFTADKCAILNLAYRNIAPDEDAMRAQGLRTRDDVFEWCCTQEEYEHDLLKKAPLLFAEAAQFFAAAESGVLICGALHLAGLAQMFNNAGHNVRVRDLTAESWWDAEVFGGASEGATPLDAGRRGSTVTPPNH